MIAAQLICEDGDLDFRHVFARQYCLSQKPLRRVDGWTYPETLLGWELAHCPKLSVTTLLDSAGQSIGWLLGTAVDRDGTLVGPAPHAFGANAQDPHFWDTIEADITDYAGRYLVILITDAGKRAYFDPVVDLPAVFNRAEKILASSPFLALSRPMTNNPRLDRQAILKDGGNYGLQQTCDPDVLRVLSNHVLDLDDFSLHRHWPGDADTFDTPAGDLSDMAERIIHRLGQVTGTILENYNCHLALSGGSDSRTLAYSARDTLHRAQTLFTLRTTWISQFDCYVASQVASELGLADRYRVFDAVKEIENRQYKRPHFRRLRWDFYHRTGYQHAPKKEELVGSSMLPDSDYVLRGNVMDIARANQWPKSFRFDLNHAISKLVLGGRTKDENVEYWQKDYQNWMATLPGSAQPRIYEFAFIEQLLPNTLGGRLIGYDRAAYINPFNDRSLIRACMQIDPATRRRGDLNIALHRACGASDHPMTRAVMADDALKAEISRSFS